MKYLRLALFAVLALACSFDRADATIVVTSGYDPSLSTNDIGVRFRSFQPTGADEVYLGVPSLGDVGNRVAQQFNWGSGPTSFAFTFNYDPGTSTLSTSLVYCVTQP